MDITTLGIDLAKSVFQLHGVDAQGVIVLQKKLRRGAVVKFLSKLEPCLIGIEACATSHYWARGCCQTNENSHRIACAGAVRRMRTRIGLLAQL